MIILASQSPRRRELLKYIYEDFSVMPVDCDETSQAADPSQRAVEVAVRKARLAAGQAGEGHVIIGADTIVQAGGRVLGKPRDEADAFAMLALLSGSTCTVFTGVAVVCGGQVYGMCQQSDVSFYPLTEAQINAYIATGEPMDKAGAFGVQGKGALLVRAINGDFYNVMGLPVGALNQLLTREGILA